MKKQILSTIISLSLLPPFLPSGVLAQDNNIAWEIEPIILAQSDSLGEEEKEANRLEQQGIELYQQGKYIEATNIFERVLEIRKRIYPEDHPDVATSLNNLAFLYNNQGRYADAEPLYIEATNLFERVLEIRKQIYPEEHPYVATSLNNLAELYRNQGRYAEAEPLYI